MRIAGLLGKLMFAISMAYFGFGHLNNANKIARLVPDFLPMSVLWVYLTGMGLVLAAIAIILNKKARLAAQLLGFMLILFATMVHLPSGLKGDEKELLVFFKDFALAGSAWFMSMSLSN